MTFKKMGGLTVDYTDEFTNNLLTLGPGEQRLSIGDNFAF